MRTLRQTIHVPEIGYSLEKIAPLEKILFLDIETTGFTAKSSSLYYVLTGQKIAEAAGFVSAPIYATVSGTVKAIEL